MMKKHLPAIALLLLAGGFGRASAQTLTNLHSFGSSPTDGVQPRAGVVQGIDGNFYGTTYSGGMYHQGTVFKITPQGMLTNLWQFDNTNGGHPSAGLVQGNNSNFYGTTVYGGPADLGTVFLITPQGAFTNLWSFDGTNGAGPTAGLVQGSDSNFYGMTQGGSVNYGTVFRITAGGTFTNLFQFGLTNGSHPLGGLIEGSDSNFYGTTELGGTNLGGTNLGGTNLGGTNLGGTNLGGTNGVGTIFKITPQGALTTLYQFLDGTNDGFGPFTGLVQGSDSNFYGTTFGGAYTGAMTNTNGTLFKITPQGAFTTIWQFNGTNDGSLPSSSLVQGSDGNFYGETLLGGTNNVGTLFRITPQGALTTLWQFSTNNTNNGIEPSGSLIQGSDGNFYGTTPAGGTNGNGTIFELMVSLNSPTNEIATIKLDPSGANVLATITSVAHETYQLQFSPSLSPASWTNLPNDLVTNGPGGLLTFTNFGVKSRPQGFFRFAITP